MKHLLDENVQLLKTSSINNDSIGISSNIVVDL